MKTKLSMQLVPSQCHGRNLRAVLKKESWDKLSKVIRKRDAVCVHCDNPSGHCHEVWEWVVSEGKLVQRLVGLEGVCKNCHDFMHYGRVQACESMARQEIVLDHALRVLSCDAEWLATYINGCFLSLMQVSGMIISDRMDLSWLWMMAPQVMGFDNFQDASDVWSELYVYVHD